MERRVIYTLDPQFPSLTISGNLPKLVVHVNEQKVHALRTLLGVISGKGLISPVKSQDNFLVDKIPSETNLDAQIDGAIGEISDSSARLLMLQFSVDQMALEVQSRGRSVAELQVNGVKLSFTKRPFDTSLFLSVHGLLLVDALQTFGPDFELLVASHKHVGMDTIKGSLQDSEPTSPTSPSSPEPETNNKYFRATSPVAISQALSTLSLSQRAKSPSGLTAPYLQLKESTTLPTDMPDVEALISLELVFINSDCPSNGENKEHLQIANIQFNNLDIIANQETIVELVGFVQRVFPKSKNPPLTVTQTQPSEEINEEGALPMRDFSVIVPTRTEVTFDFHRLNVLLLRAVVKDSGVIGKKIATATMTEAKVHANIGSNLEVEGSLGGLQVLDLTSEGHIHQRILSLGDDPLAEDSRENQFLTTMTAEMYARTGNAPLSRPNQAFSFSVKRSSLSLEADYAEINIRLASVWYTHSPHLIFELRSCAVEFKQYLANLARSIGTAATEMALGLVHARAESLAQSLSMGGRLCGSSSDISQTPRKKRSLSYSLDHLESTRGTATPFSPDECECNTLIKWDVFMASPVVVIPRNATSPQVVVGHLGSISVTNSDLSPASSPWGFNPYTTQKYDVSIRDINLYTVDITDRLANTQNIAEPSLMRAEDLYCCNPDGKSVLDNTSIQLNVVRELNHIRMKHQEDILLDSGADFTQVDQQENLKILGSFVTSLKFSLSRGQYEQFLESLNTILGVDKPEEDLQSEETHQVLANIEEEPEIHTGVSTLSMDPALRARMIFQTTPHLLPHSPPHSIALTVSFEIHSLTLELKADLGVGEQGLVDLSFKDLMVQYEKSHTLETNIQMSLKSVTMEDLQKPVDSKHRCIMVSSGLSSLDAGNIPSFYSKSCPNLSSPHGPIHPWHSSLPDHLETEDVFGAMSSRHKYIVAVENSVENRMKGGPPKCPYTPPPSPRGKTSPPMFQEDNLVHINVVMKPSFHPNVKNLRHTAIDFNCLDVIVNVESWAVVLDFFGISDLNQDEPKDSIPKDIHQPSNTKLSENKFGCDSELEISVKSLSVMLNRAEYEVTRASMSNLTAHIVSREGSGTMQTEASVGSFTLTDLTPTHSILYRERFVTAGLKLSMNKYNSNEPNENKPYDFKLKLDMTSLIYVHTQRYIAELQAFFDLFPYLRRRIEHSKGKNQMEEDENKMSTRMLLDIQAISPILILPMSSQSPSVLLFDLGKLRVSNKLLMSGSSETVGSSFDPTKEVLLDVMDIDLESTDIEAGLRHSDIASCQGVFINVGSYYIERKGLSLFSEKCHLSIHVERNLMPLLHCVPDLRICGTLTKLDAVLTLPDYKLISGILSFNIGECLDDLQLIPELTKTDSYDQDMIVWTTTSMHFELIDVRVCLGEDGSLTCITFFKSLLTVEKFSNRTQDIDLVSQKISITDTRFQDEPANKRSNVFINILQPLHQHTDSEVVQAQVHHRKRLEASKFTILLNNMRVMAVLDWWECVQSFILSQPDNVPYVPVNTPVAQLTPRSAEDIVPFELKLNITDSEVVFLEDTSQWDTNAVILKSTTVITYRPLNLDKPVSCNLNHCEMFSCILGMEDETALSIIDPVTVNIEIVCRQDDEGRVYRALKVYMVHLSLRLSYHDVRMFSSMLKSLPKQTSYARNKVIDTHPANFKSKLELLKELGFRIEDCSEALNKCNGQVDEAALWLTIHAVSASKNTTPDLSPIHHARDYPLSIDEVEVVTDCVSLCVIDDCRDADVPLIEVSFSRLKLKQNIVQRIGSSEGLLTAHYYNRLLSGWEPFIEPWKYYVYWGPCLGANKARFEMSVSSTDSLNFSITSSMVQLYKSVKEIWTQDYYNPRESMRCDSGDGKFLASPPGYRRRSPFVPFALKNETGMRLWYTTIITKGEGPGSENKKLSLQEYDYEWTLVECNATVPFSFHETGKIRHRDTHKLITHQLGLRVDGWKSIDPVTVDRVGIYFREVSPDLQSQYQDLPHARIVLEVTLEGTAKKLVKVRSALQIFNKLPMTVEVKLDNLHLLRGNPLHLTVERGGTLSVPLAFALSQIWARPLDPSGLPERYHAYCTKPLSWQHVSQPGQEFLEMRQCHTNKGPNYRFCCKVKRENYPADKKVPLAPPLNNTWVLPGHTITLLPPLILVNLLPHDLHYRVKNGTSGRVEPGAEESLSEVDVENVIEISFHLSDFLKSGSLIIPALTPSFTTRVKLYDKTKRRLNLIASITTAQPGSSLKVVISAAFWLVNKTALPLVFKQEGVATDSAGQYEEHEVARVVTPLLFSLSDNDASPTVVARIGNGVHPEGVPQWCRHFPLQSGIQVRRLKVSLRDNRPDYVYIIGVEIRPGRGRYRSTFIVTLCAHYQIHNKSSHELQFGQKCFATTFNDPGAQATYLTAIPNCSLPFHWPRLDKDQLLCLRILDIPNCLWSGGFRVDTSSSFHLNVRDTNGTMHFLRIEIVLQGATFFIVLTDAGTMPPPIRIDNFSQIPIKFHQANVTGQWCKVRPQCSLAYAWDEPILPEHITLIAPDGVTSNVDVNKLGEAPGLTYENFIYIIFTGTFKNERGDTFDLENQQLVLDVPDPSTGKVVLSRKQEGARSQLWRMTADGHLEHEGSSPPKAKMDKIMVLDICGPAPQPSQYVGLMIRRPDRRRSSTQSWRFTDDNRLCCVHCNMCVQAKDGFLGLQKGSEAVLGPPQRMTYQTTDQGIPLEQAVSRRKLRPGSGFLSVKVTTDGPTKVVQISDIKEKRPFVVQEGGNWINIRNLEGESSPEEGTSTAKSKEFQIEVTLASVGFSLVSKKPPEELIFSRFAGLKFYMLTSPKRNMYDITIQDIQMDNQVFEAQCPVVFYVSPTGRSADPDEAIKPAFSLSAERKPTKHSYNVDIFKDFSVRFKNMTLVIDERLLLKLYIFTEWDSQEDTENADESDFETQRILAEAASVDAKRYYFGSLKLISPQVRLSVIKSNKLSDQLSSVKKKLGLTLIRFEDAAVELQPFCRDHYLESGQLLMSNIIKHYKHVLRGQAAFILGSVDFLGNPLGLMADLSEGVSGLFLEGNVTALVKNVTHGISNSAAKVTESLGDGLGHVILDHDHEEVRQKIRSVKTGSSSEHIVAGLKGLGFGLVGGMTSIFKQTYTGAANDGIQGLISGFGKGLVGTVTKPVAGVLDLASETASAVRDSSRSSSKAIPERRRLPRCVTSLSGFLPPYDKKQSKGQQYLYKINNRDYSEQFMAYEILRSGEDDLRIVISSEKVRVFSCNSSSNSPTVEFEKYLSDLYHCCPQTIACGSETYYYIELTMGIDTVGSGLVGQKPIKRPRVRCDSEIIAISVSEHINYAKARFTERQQTLVLANESLLNA